MIKFEKAYAIALNKAKRLNTVKIPVERSIGRVLAENVKARIDIPPFDKSAMDGYALRAGDISKVPQALRCKGVIKAGRSPKETIKRGESIKIMTGSPLPVGADSVVMVEYTEKDSKKNCVRVLKGVGSGENVCLRGEDIRRGDLVLRRGRLMRAPEVAIAATLGHAKVKVYRMPSVAILNTGDEIVEPGGVLRHGNIYNSNGPMLTSLLSSMNVDVEYLGIAKDSKSNLRRSISRGLKKDILLVSGGVSMGDYDLVPAALKDCGVKKIFHKIRIKPGKPVFFGVKNDRLIFGVPGNPISTYLAFAILIKPVIEKMMGIKPVLNVKRGTLMQSYYHKPGRKHFVPAHVSERGGRLKVYPVRGYHGSADMASLAQANAFMVIEGNISGLRRHSRVEVVIW